MRTTIGTAMLALALATGGSAMLGGTALANVGGTSHVMPSASNHCGSFSNPNTGKCKDRGGKNATNTCVNTNGGGCTATSNKGTSATNNCVNINGTCKATTKP